MVDRVNIYTHIMYCHLPVYNINSHFAQMDIQFFCGGSSYDNILSYEQFMANIFEHLFEMVFNCCICESILDGKQGISTQFNI